MALFLMLMKNYPKPDKPCLNMFVVKLFKKFYVVYIENFANTSNLRSIN